MDTKAAVTEKSSSSIDRRDPDKTHITAWRDRDEFVSVYKLIYESADDDIESKENALQWMNMWKVRQVMDFPICVRCTFQVLEAQMFDLRCQRGGHEKSSTEIKNIYAGAFTRFINYIAEGTTGQRRRSMANHIREFGIETFLVELRHLCAHRSVPISMEVFRRSAQYCMNWLKEAYWKREIANMQPVYPWTIRSSTSSIPVPEMATILRTYDAATAGLVRNALTVTRAMTDASLSSEELLLLEAYSGQHGSIRHSVIMKQTVRQLQELKIPPKEDTVNGICRALFDNCRRMFDDAEQFGDDPSVPLGTIHSSLFRWLASVGCLQTFFEELIVICEQKISLERDLRPSAKYWAFRIAEGFQLMKQYKKSFISLPPEQIPRFGQVIKDARAKAWYAKKFPSTVGRHLILGLTVNCPWHLKLSRSYVMARLSAMNKYTTDVVPVLLTLVEPPLMAFEKRKIEHLTKAFNGSSNNQLPAAATCSGNGTPAVTKTTNGTRPEIFTSDSLLEKLGLKRPTTTEENSEESAPSSKKLKRYGIWYESDQSLDWSTYPLGTCHG